MIDLLNKQKAGFLESAWELLPTEIKNWLPESQIKANLELAWTENKERSISDVFAQKFIELCPVQGAIPQDYKYQIWEWEQGKYLMTSIRFLGLDLAKPFVELVYSNFNMLSLEEYQDLANAVAARYAKFKPQYLRVFDPVHKLEKFCNGEFLKGDLRYIAAPFGNLRSLPDLKGKEKVTLLLAEGLDFYEKYDKEVEKLYAKDSYWKILYVKKTKSEFEKLLNNKSLYQIQNKLGDWLGLIGLEPETNRFLSGYSIFEELIAERFRGRGYAAMAQRQLTKIFAQASDTDLLFGTINFDNPASIKTALRTGRKDLGGDYFIACNS